MVVLYVLTLVDFILLAAVAAYDKLPKEDKQLITFVLSMIGVILSAIMLLSLVPILE